MTIPTITLWLAFALAASAIVFIGKRRAIALAVVIAALLPATALTLGHPATNLPHGEHVVLGLKIDEPTAIYVLLDSQEGSPRYYQLPYSDETAKALQDAAYSAEESGGQVVMNNGGQGSPGFSDRAPAEPEGKQEERQVIP